jgi:hypothetical protein
MELKNIFMLALGEFEVCTPTVTCRNSDYDRIIIIISSSSSLLCIMYKYITICIFVGD